MPRAHGRITTIIATAVLVASSGLLVALLSRVVWNASGRRVVTQVPLFVKPGLYSRKITTTSASAQEYFDQGLLLLYAFDHPGARRTFEAAAAADPRCAMAYWGLAMANGPNINHRMLGSAQARAAWEACKEANRLAPKCSPVEKALIQAVGTRFADHFVEDRREFDAAYAASMRNVWRAYPSDPDVGALLVEAMLELRPWAQWTNDGKAEPGTEEALSIARTVLRSHPRHPFALHMLIHVVEASPHPEEALDAANALRTLIPLDHLFHMPSHIDIRLGFWNKATIANERAIEANKLTRALIAPDEAAYSASLTHDCQMLAYAAMMCGQRAKVKEAEELLQEAVQTADDNSDLSDALIGIRIEGHMRFGEWNEMLAEPEPEDSAQAMWHYGRAIAFAATKQVGKAKEEQELFLQKSTEIVEGPTILAKSTETSLQVATMMLAGEVSYREGRIEDGIRSLREAAWFEDQLPYVEPPSWVIPSRHALGAALMDAGRVAEAGAVYEGDLKRHPENGWALYGLSRSLERQGRKAEAAIMRSRFQRAWKDADFRIASSCCCLPMKQ